MKRETFLKKQIEKSKAVRRGNVKKNPDREFYVFNRYWLDNNYYISFDYLSDVSMEHLTFEYWKSLDDVSVNFLAG